MGSLEAELAEARELEVGALADAIESIGFECTRCGACCKGYGPEEAGNADDTDEDDPAREPHTATVFPDEIRDLQSSATDAPGVDGSYDWRDVARPMPYGIGSNAAGDPVGETFEWAIQTDACGDCTFYREQDGTGACAVHDARPLICRTYPFSVALGGTSQPMGEAVDAEGMVRAHECEGLGADIDRADAEELAAALKRRAIRELTEAIRLRDRYDPSAAEGTDADVVVHDSEGPKRVDGTPIDEP